MLLFGPPKDRFLATEAVYGRMVKILSRGQNAVNINVRERIGFEISSELKVSRPADS